MSRLSLYIALFWTAIVLFTLANLVPAVVEIVLARAATAGGM